MILNYQNELSSSTMVQISQDTKSLVFCNVKENLLLEKKSKFLNQRTLHMLQDQYVKLIRDDPGGGFYFVCCRRYGKNIQLEHSHSPDKLMKFNCSVQPGIINVMDF